MKGGGTEARNRGEEKVKRREGYLKKNGTGFSKGGDQACAGKKGG